MICKIVHPEQFDLPLDRSKVYIGRLDNDWLIICKNEAIINFADLSKAFKLLHNILSRHLSTVLDEWKLILMPILDDEFQKFIMLNSGSCKVQIPCNRYDVLHVVLHSKPRLNGFHTIRNFQDFATYILQAVKQDELRRFDFDQDSRCIKIPASNFTLWLDQNSKVQAELLQTILKFGRYLKLYDPQSGKWIYPMFSLALHSKIVSFGNDFKITFDDESQCIDAMILGAIIKVLKLSGKLKDVEHLHFDTSIDDLISRIYCAEV